MTKAYWLLILVFAPALTALANAPVDVDLMTEVWTAGDFSSAIFEVSTDAEGGYKLRATRTSFGSTDVKEVSYFKGARMLFSKTLGWTEGSDNIHKVIEAIDAIYREKIRSETDLAKLDRLLRNLLQHDALIAIFNAGRLTRFTTANTHEMLENAIMARKAKLLNADRVDTVAHWAQSDKYLAQLEESMLFGVTIDRSSLDAVLLRFEDQIKNLSKQQQAWLRSRHSYIVNNAYLRSMVDRNENSDDVILPLWISQVLARIGMSPDALAKLASDGRPVLDKRLKAMADLTKADTKEFVDRVTETIFTVVIDHTYLNGTLLSELLPDALSRKSLMRLLVAMDNVERKYRPIVEKASAKMGRDALLSALEGKSGEERALLLEKFNKFRVPDPLRGLIDSIYNVQLKESHHKLSELLRLPVELTSLIDEVGKRVAFTLDPLDDPRRYADVAELKKSFRTSLGRAWARAFAKAKEDPYIAWFKANKHAQRFDFNQADWGTDEALGDGVCGAINYSWIKAILANPDIQITAASDLKGDMGYISGSQISPKMRKAHAEYAIGVTLFSYSPRMSPPRILEKDGLTEEMITQLRTSIYGALDSVTSMKREKLSRSHGVVALGLSGPGGGHAAGFQIDFERNKFRFWDPNAGLWEYNSLDQMRKALHDFLELYYDDEPFRHFSVRQIRPKH